MKVGSNAKMSSSLNLLKLVAGRLGGSLSQRLGEEGAKMSAKSERHGCCMRSCGAVPASRWSTTTSGIRILIA